MKPKHISRILEDMKVMEIIIDYSTVCKCEHLMIEHKESCMHQYAPGDSTLYQDHMGYCICTEFVKNE